MLLPTCPPCQGSTDKTGKEAKLNASSGTSLFLWAPKPHDQLHHPRSLDTQRSHWPVCHVSMTMPFVLGTVGDLWKLSRSWKHLAKGVASGQVDKIVHTAALQEVDPSLAPPPVCMTENSSQKTKGARTSRDLVGISVGSRKCLFHADERTGRSRNLCRSPVLTNDSSCRQCLVAAN